MVSLSKAQFNKDLQHGKLGEKWFHDYCIERGLLCIPVGDDNFLGIESGIDFIVQYPLGQVGKFDVKFDSKMNRTGNMFIETFMDKERNKKGWYYNSKANRYCYIDEYNGVLWLYTKKTLDQYIAAKTNELRTIQKWLDGRKVEGILISIEDFSNWCNEHRKKLISYARMLDIDDIDEVI